MTGGIPAAPLTGEELTALVDGLAGLPYGGEAVDQRTELDQFDTHRAIIGNDKDNLARLIRGNSTIG